MNGIWNFADALCTPYQDQQTHRRRSNVEGKKRNQSYSVAVQVPTKSTIYLRSIPSFSLGEERFEDNCIVDIFVVALHYIYCLSFLKQSSEELRRTPDSGPHPGSWIPDHRYTIHTVSTECTVYLVPHSFQNPVNSKYTPLKFWILIPTSNSNSNSAIPKL